MVDASAAISGNPALKLQSGEAAAGKRLQGFSGGPVIYEPGVTVGVGLGRVAVGIVRWSPVTDDGTAVGGAFYATPMSDVLRLWPALESSAMNAPDLPLAGRIASFIEYRLLGQGRRSRPFGGRDDELAKLTAWWESLDGPPCCMMCAASGVGKSTLLVRFWRTVIERDLEDSDAVILIPVSARFKLASEESIMRALVARLAAVHGDEAAVAVAVDIDTLKDRVSNYLAKAAPDNGRLLVIVDGLDETAGWEPSAGWIDARRLGRGVRVLVAARETATYPDGAAWRSLLGWAHDDALDFELGPLTVDGIQDALHSVQPPLEDSVDLRAAGDLLWRLTEGDPLVLGLFLEDVQAAPDRESWLASLEERGPQGLDGYLRNWWRDQETLWGEPLGKRGADVRVVFNILACALGPMPRACLLGLANLFGIAHGDALDVALRDLGRWIVTDSPAQTYVLSHPRLAEHRRRQLTASELATAHRAFITYFRADVTDWGEQDWLRIDSYAVQYLAAHLEGAGLPDLVHLLLRRSRQVGKLPTNGWHSVTTLNGSIDAFAADVERGWRLAADHRQVHLQTRYALYLSSLIGSSARIPAPCLKLCVQEEVLSKRQAMSVVLMQRNSLTRAHSYQLLAMLQPQEDAWLAGAAAEFQSAMELQDDEQRGEVLERVAAVVPKHLVGATLTAALQLPWERQRASVLKALAARLSPDQHILALSAARSIQDPVLRARSLATLVRAAGVPVGPVRTALKRLARRVQDDVKVGVLCELARLPGAPAAVIDEILQVVAQLDYSHELAPAVGWLATLDPATIPRGYLDDLLTRMDHLRRHEEALGTLEAHVSALVALGPMLSEKQRAASIAPLVSRLEGLADTKPHRGTRMYTSVLAPYLPVRQRRAAFRKYLRSLVTTAGSPVSAYYTNPWGQTELIPLWRRQAALTALSDLPEGLVPLAVEAAERLTNDEGRADVLAVLVPKAPPAQRHEILQRELGRLRSIGDGATCGTVLATLVPHLVPDERTPAAVSGLEAALAAGESAGDFTILKGLLPYLPPDTRASALRRALELVKQMRHTLYAARALVSLVPVLPGSATDRVLELSDSMGDEKPLVLAHLVSRLPAKQRPQVVEQIVTDLEGWYSTEMPDDFVNALSGLAAHLDENQTDRIVSVIAQVSRISPRHLIPAVTQVAPYLNMQQRGVILSAAAGLGNDFLYIHTIVRFAQDRPKRQRMAELAHARRIFMTIKDPGEQLRALAVLSPQDQMKYASESLRSALGIERDDQRAQALAKLWPQLSADERYGAFDLLLRSCLGVGVTATVGATVYRQHLGRSFLLERIAELSAYLTEMGGMPCASEVASAVRDCGTWWP